MRPKPFPFTLVLAVVFAAGFFPGARAQQNAVSETHSPDDIEEVVVTARRREGSGGGRRPAASREQLDRSDQTGMDGFFDDIDGLSTLGGDDQGNPFSIGGLDADLGNITLNGQGFGEGTGNGGFAAGDLSPDMIRRVDVFKIPSASMEEGGSAGSVNLQLRNPAAIAERSVTLKGRLGYVPDDGRFNPSASFFIGSPSDDRKFGYMLNATVSDRTREYARQDIDRWIPEDFEQRPAWYPGQVRNSEVKDGQRHAFTGLTVGFRPTDAFDISGNLFLSRKERSIGTDSLQNRFEKQRQISVGAFDGRIVSELLSSDKSRENLRISGSMRDDRIDSLLLGVDFNWHRKRWRVHGAFGYSRDENENITPSLSASFAANSTFGYRAAGDGSLRTFDVNGFSPISAFALNRINLTDRATVDRHGFGGLDVTRQWRHPILRRISFGVKSRESTRSRRQSNGRTAVDDDLALDDFFAGQYRQTPWDEAPWPGGDMATIRAYARESEADWKENLLNEYDMARRSDAAYLQADFRGERDEHRLVVGNAGIRFVDTETRIDGYRQAGDSPEPHSTVSRYSDLLPSVTARLRLAQRTVLTIGAARVMTHPSFNDLAPGIRVNYADKTARSGNPELEPFRANQYLAELTRAWNGRRLTANLTYRDVDTYFALGEESVEIDDETLLVTRPVNGEDGSILTLGLGLQQNLARVSRRLRGYSLLLSYVHNHSRTEMRDPLTGETLPMPNTAEHVVRADLVYGRKAFSGKLSYQWRGESLKASVSESGLSVWNRPAGSLNLNLGWILNRTVRFNLDARNLVAEEQVQTTDDAGQIWRITERDRTIAATVQAKW